MLKKTSFSALALLFLVGCMGNSALTKKVRKANLSVVEANWGREIIFLGLHAFWVYRICAVLDLFIFNSIEFWTGENIINGQKALVDFKDTDKLALKNIKKAQIARIDEHNAKLYLDFKNGDHLTMDVVRKDKSYTVSYLGKKLYTGKIVD